MGRLSTPVFVRMALRSALLQATWNYERQQGLGWAWSLKPALDRLYPDDRARLERLAEHTAYFNTQPTVASLALGAVARIEERRADGEDVGADSVTRVKGVLGASLAALGDRLFWFSLRPFAACLGILFSLSGSWVGAAVLWVCYNLVHQSLRGWGVAWGYHGGPAVLDDRLRAQMGGLTRFLGIGGAALAGVIAAVALVPGGRPAPLVFQALVAAGLTLGLLAAQRSRPSPTEWGLGVGVLCIITAWLRT